MKRLLIVLLLFSSFLIFPHFIFAQNNFRSGPNAILAPNEVINQDYFTIGRNVTVDGTINGDAYIGGSEVTFNGLVNGDLLAAGGNININGVVTGNIRAAGGNININGKVGRNISVVGGNILLTPKAEVSGSFITAGGNFDLLGPIGKSLNAAGGNLQIGNTINGDVNAGIGQLTVSSGAKINGNITYWSNNKASVNPQAIVSGNITQRTPPSQWKTNYNQMANRKTAVPGGLFAFKIIGFLSALVIGFLMLKLFPIFSSKVSMLVTQKWLLSLGVGFLILAVTPVLVILLMITVLGIPIAIIWLFVVFLGLWLAKIFLAIVLGTYIAKYFKLKWNNYLVFFVGLFIYYLFGAIPFLGWLFTLVTVLMGLGALFLTKKNYYTELSQKKLI